MSAAPTSEIQHVQAQPIAEVPMESMSLRLIQDRMTAIQQLVKEVMKLDIDYGLIPGCGDKPALFKPGAEMICTMFKLVPKFDVVARDLPNGHREYQVTVTLCYGPSGQFWGQGVGMCSTMESKYRYRGTQVEPTGVALPRGYWDLKDFAAKEKFLATAMNAANGKDFTPKKIDGAWQICRKTAEKAENADPADQFNTALKMGKKRALVDATLTATAASRVFSQDMEDLEEMIESTPLHVDSRPVNGSSQLDPGRDDRIREEARRRKSAEQSGPRWQQAVSAFADFSANQKDLEELVTRPAAEWTEGDFTILETAYAALKSGEKKPGDYFARLAAKADEQAPQQGGKQGSMFGNPANQSAFKR